ncbi:MAG: AAA family ATPase [Planctomycetes bacterium]|nr:AAA family ATPase [Planctomycetota bacterium]
MSQGKSPFLRRVALRNYKSIRECNVELGQLMLLVGPNGSGKSNFLDALRFATESLRTTMDQALRERGGIKEVRRRSRGHPTHFSINLELILPEGENAFYHFRVGAKQEGRYEIQEEDCVICNGGSRKTEYHVKMGKVEHASVQPWPPASTDRLYLTIASGFPEFRPLYDLLSGMGFYNISPDRLRDLQEPDAGNLLLRDGRNLTGVLAWIERNNPKVKVRIEEYLGNIVSGIKHVDRSTLGPKETIAFKQVVAGDENPWSFHAQNMSDGTLRALGVLVSLFQCFGRPPEAPIPLVGIEEPEATLHPAATSALMAALREASNFTQVLATSHSPELLDDPDLGPETLLAVDANAGETTIGAVNEASISTMRDRLFTAGELLKLDQLKPAAMPASTEDEDEEHPLFRANQCQ